MDEGPASWDSRLFLRYKLARGITILQTAGAYTAVRYPSQDEIAAATAAYLGGHEYTVDDTTKAALIAAGLGITETNFSQAVAAYGSGAYGEGPYGG